MTQQVNIDLTPVVKLMRQDALNIIMAGKPEAETGSLPTSPVQGNKEARALVDLYYLTQNIRKATANQARAIDQGADYSESHGGISYLLTQATTLEDNCKAFLEVWASLHPMWPWFQAVHGIGPVLSAGILAHLDGPEIPLTVGSWWNYAGLNPKQRWLKEAEVKEMWDKQEGDIEQRARNIAAIACRNPGTVIRDAVTNHKTGEVSKITKAKAIKSLCRIPYNRPLKTLMWKIGDQFVKLGSNQNAHYAVMYRNRKAQEVARNERGDRKALAEETLRKFPNHAQKKIYEAGKLPDGRLGLMARRYVVKMFLSHLHELWFYQRYGKEPPKPFSIAIQGHAHYIPPYYADAIRPKLDSGVSCGVECT